MLYKDYDHKGTAAQKKKKTLAVILNGLGAKKN
jgi:hypothetical protein